MIVAVVQHVSTFDWVGIIGIAVSTIVTVTGWIVLRRPTKKDKIETELTALTEYKNSLEKQLDVLRDSQEKSEEKQIKSDEDAEAQDDVLSKCKEQVAQMTSQISSLSETLDSLKNKTQSQEDRLLEARITISILNQQKDQLIKRFDIPTSIARKSNAK